MLVLRDTTPSTASSMETLREDVAVIDGAAPAVHERLPTVANAAAVAETPFICRRPTAHRRRQSLRLESLIWHACLALFLMSQISFAHQKRCAACSLDTFEEFKQFRQQQILNDLLRKLELAAKPNVTIDYDNLPPIGRQNPRIKALIEQTIREKKRARRSLSSASSSGSDYVPDLYLSDTETRPQVTFIAGEQAPWPVSEEMDIVMFNINPSLRKKYIQKASLHVFVRRPDVIDLENIPVRIDVFERFLNGTIGDKIATKFQLFHGLQDIHQVNIPLDGADVGTWLDMQVQSRRPAFGLYIEAAFEGENLVLYPRDHYRENMYLELEVLDNPGRSRRSSPQVCTAGTNESKCCLYDLIIDFEKVGWEFVIAPKRYNAYMCNGDCTNYNAGLPMASNYGSVTAKLNTDFYQCCHPKDYTGVTVVYVTEANQIWVKEVPGMVARKCGCA